jgi:hypothetical protein
MTDNYPEETSWTLTNVNSNDVTISIDAGTYSNKNSLYEEIYCIEATQCYEFTISDSYGDGICCSEGNGYFKILYEEELLLEGGDFGGSQSSALFGNGCPTESPTVSSAPSSTVSSIPSSTPSLSVQPSSNPTLSLKPSDEPSWSPTTSSIPTSSPDQDTNLIVKDEYNRRYFPAKIPVRPEGSFPYQPVPDCSSSIGRIGCVAIPSSFEAEASIPHWAGTLHTIPPSCNNRKRKCTVGIPTPRTTHELGKNLIPVLKERAFDDAVDLPGGALGTRSVAIADMNNDGLLDIVTGNYNDKNQLIINAGDGTFLEDAVDLPGGALGTISVAIADMNNDGLLDIVIGNDGDKNQLIINAGDGTFLEDAVDLPGGALYTQSVAIADMNNDGLLDIVIGNYNDKNQLIINAGDGTFLEDAVDLPGGALRTFSVAIADMNNDGLLDIVIGDGLQYNQFLPYLSCPIGSAQLHSKSWCFQCPSFMGEEINMCRECMPDYMQKPGTSDYQCEDRYDKICPFGQRILGEDECSKQCPDGTYFDNELTRFTNDPSTWEDDRCVPCSPGQFVTEGAIVVNKCLECLPGTFQPEVGATTCLDCQSGEFQTEFGKDFCDSCPKGGYCDAANKPSAPCPPRTYNDKMGQSSESACQLCPSGTYSTTSGGDSIDVCLECPPGTYNDQPGKY